MLLFALSTTTAALQNVKPPTKVTAAATVPAKPLEKANRCTLLPSKPVSATIIHVGDGSPPTLCPDEVQFVIGGAQSAVSMKPAIKALGAGCKKLVRELGEVDAIRLAPGQPPLTGLWLRAAYGGAPLERPRSGPQDGEEEAGEEEEEAATLRHRCDVLFARRGLRQRVGEAGSSAMRGAKRVPILGNVVRAATGTVAEFMEWQLTPTYQPTLTLRLLKQLPWRCQRLGARLWLQAMLYNDDAAADGEEEEDLEAEDAASASAAAAVALTAQAAQAAPHPMEAVRTLPMLDATECEAAICEAEEHAAANGGWLTDRHVVSVTTMMFERAPCVAHLSLALSLSLSRTHTRSPSAISFTVASTGVPNDRHSHRQAPKPQRALDLASLPRRRRRVCTHAAPTHRQRRHSP